MIARGGTTASIGMGSIKERRLELPVKCYSQDVVGDYVPFYFCPRSIMLYMISRANHPDLAYYGGQHLIVHLEADLLETVKWADAAGRRWAFTLSNAGARYTEFRNSLEHLDEIDWAAVRARDFRDPHVKEGKQAECLVHGAFAWRLVQRIGVESTSVAERVSRVLIEATHRPVVEVLPEWYF